MGMKINVITLCSGYDAMTMGLKRLKNDYPQFDFELLAWSEIADAPIKAHKACHPESADRNLGDMSKIDWKKWNAENGNPNIDLLFYSTPCTSVSAAGKNKGAEEGSGTESALIWYTKHAIRELHPRILICENVKGMVSGKNLKTFHKWQHELESYGYTNFTSILDARDYGVAQHRERLFMVSILDCTEKYYFPKPFKLEKRLKDYLEDDVPESYYLKPEQVANIVAHCDRKQTQDGINIVARLNSSQDGVVVDIDGVSPCHCVGHGNMPKIAEPQSDATFSIYANQNGEFFRQPMKDVCKTIRTDGKMGVIETQIGISIHPLNRKMEFNGYRSVRCDVAPTLTAHDGKGGEPCVWEVEPTIQSFASYVPNSACGGKIVKAGGIAPTVMENHGNVTAVAEPQIIGYTRSDDGKGISYHTKDVANTLHGSTGNGGNTDQFISEPQIIQLFQLYPDSNNTQVGRVYDIDGISPTLSTACGGHHEPKILTQVRTEEAKELRRKGIDKFSGKQLLPREDDCCGTITTVQNGCLLQEPISCAVRGRGENNEQRLEIGEDSANCVTSVQKDSMVMEPNGKTTFITDPSVWVSSETNKAYYYKDGCLWRIRRLMPVECLKLMDVGDEYISNMCNCGLSKTSLYSLAGNSIVVNVLYHIFKKLFIDKSNPDQQLTLF